MLRAAFVFVVACALLRLAGRRSFAQRTPFELFKRDYLATEKKQVLPRHEARP